MYTGVKAIQFGRKLVIKAAPTLGLARFFPIRPGNIFGAETVQYDSTQKREKMSLPVARGGGARRSVPGGFDKVTEQPPYLDERLPINFNDLKGRAAGMHEYDPANVDHVARLIDLMTEEYADLQDLIDRQIEFQAAEVFQFGEINWKQFAGVHVPVPNGLYDFKMSKADLFLDAGVAWATATGKQMLDQLQTLADNIRKLGKANATDIIMGRTAKDNFIGNAEIQALLDNRRIQVGDIIPQPLQGDGFAFQGTITIGAQVYRIWLYEGRYENPETGALDFYIKPTKVVMIAEAAERDRFHAGVDIMKPTNAEFMNIFPGGVSLATIADRVPAIQVPYAISDDNAQTTEIGIASSPLLVPTNRGGHGCLETAP
jgi:hypothetical protein